MVDLSHNNSLFLRKNRVHAKQIRYEWRHCIGLHVLAAEQGDFMKLQR